jgi:hypothetical protein
MKIKITTINFFKMKLLIRESILVFDELEGALEQTKELSTMELLGPTLQDSVK